MVTQLRTPRLDLVLLDEKTLHALIEGDRGAAQRESGLNFPADFPGPSDLGFLEVQVRRNREQPDGRAWCVRAMVHRATGDVIGHCGFHGPPDVIGRAELGYTVFPSHRRHGYAAEAARALIEWARSQGQRSVFASIGTDNAPSLAMARSLGFRPVGSQMDDIDGEELVFELDLTVRDSSIG